MPDSIITACPECNKKLRVAEKMAGKKVRCRNCSHTFEVPAPEPREVDPLEAARRALDEEFDPEVSGRGYDATAEDLAARCPTCAAALEEEDQVICMNCGYNLRTRQRTDHRTVYETTGNETFMWLLPGIISVIVILSLIGLVIVCIFNMTAWAESYVSFLKKEEGGWYLRPGAFTFGIGLVSFFVCVKLGKFAYKRLVVQNKPPEVEKR